MKLINSIDLNNINILNREVEQIVYIRDNRRLESYKGKSIKNPDEVIRLKVDKGVNIKW